MEPIKWRRCRGLCLSAFDELWNTCEIVFVLSCFALFLLQESMFQWIRNPKGKWINVGVLQEPNTELEISLRPMEYLEEEQQSQQHLERNLNAY